ncbi:hypothetical protein CSQ79_08740 [Gloeocapsopsis sp. IPPAS B-1203]|nr:hypothetical protein CSQ79_08740 [Gloeocapsopsis sp. IPPAS B-1203]
MQQPERRQSCEKDWLEHFNRERREQALRSADTAHHEYILELEEKVSRAERKLRQTEAEKENLQQANYRTLEDTRSIRQ